MSEQRPPSAPPPPAAASEERILASTAELEATASKPRIFFTNLLQALLVAAVVIWVLDIPRLVFNASLYKEQLLTVCLGLTLGLAYIAETTRPRHWLDWVAMTVSLLLCGYIAVRYEALTIEL